MSSIRVMVLSGYGLNCDHETAYAFELAGAQTHRIHINTLIRGSVNLSDYQILAFVGGFSWGDDHGGGVVQAVRLKTKVGRNILAFMAAGKLVMGICNGFQALVNMGLLPGFDQDYQTRSVALTFNDCGNFRNQWINLKANPASSCIYTQGIDQLELPVRHGEGKFFSDPATIERLVQNEQIALQYALPDGNPAKAKFPFNPNGSLHDIAGICDSTGRIFGLMPHPEAFNHWTNHPDWAQRKENRKRSGTPPDSAPAPGIRIFQNAVDYFR
ncbi:MAG: phosphoribosylformylglycinamidine synthase subunit PurQ [Desulfobacterales bacterium]